MSVLVRYTHIHSKKYRYNGAVILAGLGKCDHLNHLKFAGWSRTGQGLLKKRDKDVSDISIILTLSCQWPLFKLKVSDCETVMFL